MKTPKKQHAESQTNDWVPQTPTEPITFYGVLGRNCGTVEPYSGPNKQILDKGFVVRDGIPTLRGFAKISDLASASQPKYVEYQRQKTQSHVDEIVKFLDECKSEAKGPV